MYSDPSHFRWIKRLREITEKFDGKCIFWGGIAADAINSYNDDFHEGDKEEWFNEHFTHVAMWQSNSLQARKHLLGCPYVSPYHSGEIWNKLYKHYDPEIFDQETDFRKEIAEKLTEEENWFPKENPAPSNIDYYQYRNENPKSIYIEEIKKKLRRKEE